MDKSPNQKTKVKTFLLKVKTWKTPRAMTGYSDATYNDNGESTTPSRTSAGRTSGPEYIPFIWTLPAGTG